MRRGGQVTISGVAAAAGVSKATVSRVMNQVPTVAPDIATRVLETAQRLGYQPSATAQNLSRGRTGAVGVVVPDLSNPVFTLMLKGIELQARQDGFHTLVADANEEPEQELWRALELARLCDGLILCGPRMSDDALASLLSTDVPAVVLNRRTAHDMFASVWIDCGAAIADLCRHLDGLGHSRLAYLAGPQRSAADADRWAALQAAAAPAMRLDRIRAGAMMADGYRAAEQAVATGATCLVGYNDLVALGAMTRLRELGRTVPGDVSVAGIDDMLFASYTGPALTTIAVPQAEAGREAWRLLAPYLQGRKGRRSRRLSGTFVPRDSTGPAPLG